MYTYIKICQAVTLQYALFISIKEGKSRNWRKLLFKQSQWLWQIRGFLTFGKGEGQDKVGRAREKTPSSVLNLQLVLVVEGDFRDGSRAGEQSVHTLHETL